MTLDREYQLELLQAIATTYPLPYQAPENPLGAEKTLDERKRYLANMIYLEQHELIDSGIRISADHLAGAGDPVITHKGMDFLADDGGLSAILGVMTVRLEADTLKAILSAKINESHVDDTLKSKMLSQLRDLPLAATKHLASELLKRGLDRLPDVVPLIQSYLS